MGNEFEVTYGVDDGYCGGDAPHHFAISSDILCGGESDADLSKRFWDAVRLDFRNTCRPYSDQESAFISWAREHLKLMEDDQETDHAA